jgi:hypothetical protein
VITATATASRLSDLTDDTWLVVARQVTTATPWHYMMPDQDVKSFHSAVTHRDIVSVQRREDRGFVLLAKLARVRGARR